MKKPFIPLEKHATHEVEIRLVSGKHFAKYHCVTCNKWVAWLSKQDSDNALKLGLVND